ncbi:MAG: methyltransferase domain-containing protein [Proteobacteria bacterium]|nr:methyltransferase domain-containing protein [Pseudomonadota bacterium]
MSAAAPPPLLLDDELDLLADWVPLPGAQVIELGCGAAALARQLVARFAGAHVTALEVDERQHAKNLAAPAAGIRFVAAGAQAVPFGDGGFDLALMLKSLHHVPRPLMGQALAEAARVLRPGGHLYVSEPVYAGALNDLVKLYNEERAVREAAQAALDAALQTGPWEAVREARFETPVHFADFAAFEQRMMRPTFADHRIDDAKLAAVSAAFAPHRGPDGAHFTRPMHARLLRRRGG